jgi:hypothetical protein
MQLGSTQRSRQISLIQMYHKTCYSFKGTPSASIHKFRCLQLSFVFKETYENPATVLHRIKYDDYNLDICGDLKVIGLFLD